MSITFLYRWIKSREAMHIILLYAYVKIEKPMLLSYRWVTLGDAYLQLGDAYLQSLWMRFSGRPATFFAGGLS